MPLELRQCQSSNVTDLTLIKDLWPDFQPARDTALLRSMPTLEYVNDKPVAEGWTGRLDYRNFWDSATARTSQRSFSE